MPFLLRDRDLASQIGPVRSALIVPCRFCPAASLAVRTGQPYVDVLRSFLRTSAYESHIRSMKARLEAGGITADVFDSRWPHQFVMCMWSWPRRRALALRATRYDAIIVLGCDAAVDTARQAVAGTACRVIPAMEVEGIMNVVPRLQFPVAVRLSVTSITPARLS